MFTILGDPYPNIELFMDENIHDYSNIELFMDENIHDYSNTELLTDGNHEFLIHPPPPSSRSQNKYPGKIYRE